MTDIPQRNNTKEQIFGLLLVADFKRTMRKETLSMLKLSAWCFNCFK